MKREYYLADLPRQLYRIIAFMPIVWRFLPSCVYLYRTGFTAVYAPITAAVILPGMVLFVVR